MKTSQHQMTSSTIQCRNANLHCFWPMQWAEGMKGQRGVRGNYGFRFCWIFLSLFSIEGNWSGCFLLVRIHFRNWMLSISYLNRIISGYIIQSSCRITSATHKVFVSYSLVIRYSATSTITHPKPNVSQHILEEKSRLPLTHVIHQLTVLRSVQFNAYIQS